MAAVGTGSGRRSKASDPKPGSAIPESGGAEPCDGVSDPVPPDGGTLPYPAGPYETTIGATVENITLNGYPLGAKNDVHNKWKQVQLAQYWNPDGTNKAPDGTPYKTMFIDLSALWCSACRAEAPRLNGLCVTRAAAGLGCYTAITQNQDGSDPVQADVDSWLHDYNLQFATVVDDGSWNSYFRQEFLPLNMFIDLKTMKIVDREYGEPANGYGPLMDQYTACATTTCADGGL